MRTKVYLISFKYPTWPSNNLGFHLKVKFNVTVPIPLEPLQLLIQKCCLFVIVYKVIRLDYFEWDCRAVELTVQKSILHSVELHTAVTNNLCRFSNKLLT